MIYRENGEPVLYEEHRENIVLKKRSFLGPWVVTGLGTMLAFFLLYLVYSNLLVSPTTVSSPERSLRVIVQPIAASAAFPAKRSRTQPYAQRGAGITMVPQSRASNALLGGQGPVSLAGVSATTTRGTQGFPSKGAATSH